MSDSLHDRIADLLAHHPTFNLKDDGYSADDVLRMADVLQHELGLHKERYRHKCSNQCLSDCKQMQHRYVTDWEME